MTFQEAVAHLAKFDAQAASGQDWPNKVVMEAEEVVFLATGLDPQWLMCHTFTGSETPESLKAEYQKGLADSVDHYAAEWASKF